MQLISTWRLFHYKSPLNRSISRKVTSYAVLRPQKWRDDLRMIDLNKLDCFTKQERNNSFCQMVISKPVLFLVPVSGVFRLFLVPRDRPETGRDRSPEVPPGPG